MSFSPTLRLFRTSRALSGRRCCLLWAVQAHPLGVHPSPQSPQPHRSVLLGDRCHQPRHLALASAFCFSSSSQQGDDIQTPSENEGRPVGPDPTAKRPTKQCDPYGLSGASLPYSQALDLLPTVVGWTLLDANECSIEDTSATGPPAPKFLQKVFYHRTFHDASRFLLQISLLATNTNHFPHLSMERILVDDVNNIKEAGESSDDPGKTGSRGKMVKGWAFQSTVRCSTYRPPRTKSQVTDEPHGDKGLTFHDFHFAMSVDVEASRPEVEKLIL
ncbi:hypothetical protein THAOC_12919 [Thalassiosira oceanica]|uniref:Uncharacterized protein n=1 Tax=Thalassiosira oceanica TaxID=159749 RepID=K0SJ03_THAOC|nr:hypothetical protein THAOC_12919 [Thalassiosira oceanica]|eukprot:EJK66178.1 hypothetical protein THAOC_12919 [Thalassiosira oceanica]